jgi:aminoglycoside phosphotransferase (APT) family kinase protein
MAGRSSSTTSELEARLGPHVRSRLGADAELVGLSRLPGGASRETWRLDVRRGDVAETLVLRRDPAGHVIESSREGEFALLQAAAAAGVPVARLRWVEADPAVLGSPFFVMDFVEGETIGRRILREERFGGARAVLPEQLATALARVHAIDAGAPGLAFLARPDAGASPARAEAARYDQILRDLAPDPHPVLDLAVRWLGARVPPARETTVVHGDYRIGNVIVDETGLSAVLDWELAHLGDPIEDLGWFCVRAWRFGNDDRPAGGLCDRERFVAAYERARATTVDRAAVRWWEVFGNFKWAVICIMQAETHRRGAPNVELASLGRRTAETELELLDLMDEFG